MDYAQLQADMRDHRCASSRRALCISVGIDLITDTRDGRRFVGKADALRVSASD